MYYRRFSQGGSFWTWDRDRRFEAHDGALQDSLARGLDGTCWEGKTCHRCCPSFIIFSGIHKNDKALLGAKVNATMMVGRYKKTCGLVIDIIYQQPYSCVWSAQQRSICWLPLRPTPQMRPSRPSVSRSVSCPLNEPWREILPIWIGWEFCIRHVPRPWKSNSTVQRGRRRHVQEAPGRWRTRLAGKEKEILSVQTSNSPGTSGGFSDFEMSWLDPREIHQTVQCQVCISTPWIWRRLGWLHHTRPCSHLQSRSVSLYCLARS